MRIPEDGEFGVASFLEHRTLSGVHRTVRCTPDSPVNYSGATLHFPEGEEFSAWRTLVHRTCPVRPTRVPSVVPLLFLLNPFLGLFIGLL
jgi:hypothetical protein